MPKLRPWYQMELCASNTNLRQIRGVTGDLVTTLYTRVN